MTATRGAYVPMHDADCNSRHYLGICDCSQEVVGLQTIQWSWGGLFDGKPAPGFDVCLVRSTRRGTPGPTLCGRDRFAPDAPGWSVGGGITGPNVHNAPCAGCVEVRDRDYPHLPVGGSLFRGMFATPVERAS